MKWLPLLTEALTARSRPPPKNEDTSIEQLQHFEAEEHAAKLRHRNEGKHSLKKCFLQVIGSCVDAKGLYSIAKLIHKSKLNIFQRERGKPTITCKKAGNDAMRTTTPSTTLYL